MIKYTGYIVDDENLARYTLRKKLNAYPEIEIIGEANNLQSALDEIPKKVPDILFLDIQLHEGTGFDLLNGLNYNGKVIFITAFDQYAIRAFEINAVDYLLKPISNKRLKEAINRVKSQRLEKKPRDIVKLQHNDRFLISTIDSMNFIKLSEIVFIKSSGDYTELRLSDGKTYLESRSMLQWEECLPENHFCRISRFYIVNFDYISEIKKSFTIPGLLFIKGIADPFKISKSFFQQIKSKYK